MQVIRGQHNIRAQHRGCVATIGNFDGVHLGHVAVLTALKAQAAAYQLPTLVVIFEPQPLEYLCPAEAPVRLTRLADKLALLQQQGIDRVLVLRFDQACAHQTAAAFIQQLLVTRLGVRHLYVGDDFQFGRGRQGNLALLQQMGAEQGFAVERLATVSAGAERISSTRIRAALAQGDLTLARRCLGRHYSLRGRVQHGDQRGRTWDFPTLNLPVLEHHCPLRGVYLVEVTGIPSGPYVGVANVGWRPTVAADLVLLLEVHVLDFAQEIYGLPVQVHFQTRLRAEQKFDSFTALQKQIQRDVQQARLLLAAQDAV